MIRRTPWRQTAVGRGFKRLWESVKRYRNQGRVSRWLLCGATSRDNGRDSDSDSLSDASEVGEAPYRRDSTATSRTSIPTLGSNNSHEPPDEGDDDAQKICTICTRPMRLSRFPGRAPTASCTHEPTTCKACLRTWITHAFTTRMWNEIDCPDCRTQLERADVEAFAKPSVAARYARHAERVALEATPGFRYCIADKCDSGQVHEEGSSARFVCVKCKAEHCVVHDVPWHKKETCAEYEWRTRGKKRHKQDKATQKWLVKKTKKCPGCGWGIEKRGGCAHMRCSKCGFEFCYKCLGEAAWRDDGYTTRHAVDCSLYGEDNL